MLSRERQMRIRRAIARSHGTKPARALAAASRFYLVGYENHDWEMRTNGELRVLEHVLASFPAPTVFDVGANLGDWTAAVLERSDATIHAFELIPETSRRLAERFGHDPRVHVNDVGLLDEAAERRARHDPEKSTVSRVVHEDEPAADGLQTVRAVTGDAYCAGADVSSIDLLKIDTEGSDLRVLRGFEQMLTDGRISTIQFEHGSVSAEAGVRLQDFYRLLEPLGFRVGKIYPKAVEFKPYGGQRDEEFAGLNYLAVRGDDPALITALSN